MREREVIETKFDWEGRAIRLSYTPRQYGVIDHVAICAEGEEPLPITETGYKSHYFGPVEPSLSINEVVHMVVDWLNREARKPVWKTHVEASRQGSLF